MPIQVVLEAELTDLASPCVEDFGREPHDTTDIGLPCLLETQHIAGNVFGLAHQIREIVGEIVSDELEIDLQLASLKRPTTEDGRELVFPQIPPESIRSGSGRLENA